MSPGLGMQQNGRCGVQLITAFPNANQQPSRATVGQYTKTL